MTLTNQELLLVITEKAQELGRAPKQKEIDKIFLHKITWRFGSWNNAIRLAGLKVLKSYSESDLIKILKNKSKELGRTPKKREIKQCSVIQKKFGSWNNALRIAGLKLLKDFETKDFYRIIQDWIIQNERLPTIQDFSTNIYLPDPRTIIRALKKTWREILIDLGYDVTYLKKGCEVKETNEKLIKIYQEFSNKIGKNIHGATIQDLNTSKEIYSYTVFYTRFNGLSNLRKLAGFTPRRHTLQFSKTFIKKLLIKKSKKYGRKLTNLEIDLDNELPSRNTILSRFKSTNMSAVWAQILK